MSESAEVKNDPTVTKQDPSGVTKDEKTWALLSHLAYLVIGIIGPLVIMLMKKEESSFIEDQAKEALNFQLSVAIVTLVCTATCVLSPLAIVAAVAGIYYCIVATLESQKGHRYRYPYTFRMIK